MRFAHTKSLLFPLFNFAGGPTKGAEDSGSFMLCAYASMVSKPRRAGFLGLCIDWHRKSDAALTGDIAFAPEEVSKTTWVQGLKEGTQIRYRFGIGAEGLKTRNI